MKINRIFFRYLTYAVEIVLLYLLQNSPKVMPELFGSKPLLLVPAALVISAFESTIPSIVIGAVCGVLTDIGSGYIGWYAVLLMLVCFIQSELLHRYFVPSFLTAEVYSFVSIIMLVWFYFVIFVLLSDVSQAGYLFVHRYISRAVYSFFMTIPMYFINKFLYNRLHGV